MQSDERSQEGYSRSESNSVEANGKEDSFERGTSSKLRFEEGSGRSGW